MTTYTWYSNSCYERRKVLSSTGIDSTAPALRKAYHSWKFSKAADQTALTQIASTNCSEKRFKSFVAPTKLAWEKTANFTGLPVLTGSKHPIQCSSTTLAFLLELGELGYPSSLFLEVWWCSCMYGRRKSRVATLWEKETFSVFAASFLRGSNSPNGRRHRTGVYCSSHTAS